jgi:branched-chain amino acid transport system substrate-binding protein
MRPTPQGHEAFADTATTVARKLAMSYPGFHLFGRSMLAACAVALVACAPSIPETVKIGVAVTTSGPPGPRGQDLLNGALLAAKQLNDEGFKINGKPVKIEIVAKDDKGDIEVVKTVAQELVNEGVHAVIGHINTAENQAAIPIYASKGLPHFFTSSNRSLMSLGVGNTFRLVAHDGVQARALGVFAIESLRAQRLAAIVEIGTYGEGIFEDMKASLPAGKTVVERIDIDVKAPVTEAMANKIKAAQADVVMVIGREVHALSLLEQLKSVQYTSPAVLAANPARTVKLAKVEGPVARLYATATTIDATELGHGKQFLDAFRAQFKSEPVWGAHYAYDAVNTLADAMRAAGTVDGKAVVARIKKFEPNTKLLHQLRFDETGEQKYPSVGVYKREGGVWQPHTRSAAW